MTSIEPYMSTILLVLGAIVVLVLLIIAIRMLGGNVRGRRGSRLGISEYHELDKTRRLVLVRRDDVEHLLLIGGGHDMVVESGIGASAPAERAVEREASPAPARMAPRAPVFAARRPPLRPVEGTTDPTRGNEPQL